MEKEGELQLPKAGGGQTSADKGEVRNSVAGFGTVRLAEYRWIHTQRAQINA